MYSNNNPNYPNNTNNNPYGQQYVNGMNSLQHNLYSKQVNNRMQNEMRPMKYPNPQQHPLNQQVHQIKSGAYCNIDDKRPRFNESSQTQKYVTNTVLPPNNQHLTIIIFKMKYIIL